MSCFWLSVNCFTNLNLLQAH